MSKKNQKSKATLKLVTLEEKQSESELEPRITEDIHTFELSETATECVIVLKRDEKGWRKIHVTEEAK